MYNVDSRQVAFTGKIAFRKPKNTAETGQPNETPYNNFGAADVWECDFSAFNAPGNYRVVVPGMGSSFTFRIEGDAYREAFYWTMKGLYHNRSGIELKASFTDFPRPAPHNPRLTPGFAGRLKYSKFRAFDLSSADGSAGQDKAKVEAGYQGVLESTYGWYQDAGDWDGYYTHSHIPAYLLFLYETGPGKFTDGELGIPESGNSLPDVLDEALWLLRYYKRAKDEIEAKGWGTGGVPGARAFGDLWGGDTRADGTTKGSWEDTDRDWYLTGEDPWMSYKYAALAAQAAYIMKTYHFKDPQKVNWMHEALKAYKWALKNTRPDDELPKLGFELRRMRMYANAALYRLTGEAEYHARLKADVTPLAEVTIDLDGTQVDQMFAAWVYLRVPAGLATDADLRAKFLGAATATADNVLINTAEQRATRWGGNFYFPMLIGQPTTPMITPGVMGYTVNQSADPGKAGQYLKYIHTTADYFLGANPLSTTWISGVGERYPKGVFHLDWWYSGKDQVIQGIVPYGPWRVQDFGPLGWWNPNWAYTDAKGNPRVYPADINTWPGHERWFDQRTSPLTGEFTVHQNTVVAAFVYGFLTEDKGTAAAAARQSSEEAAPASGLVVFPNPAGGELNLKLTRPGARLETVQLHALDGKKVWASGKGKQRDGEYVFDISALKPGMYVLRAQLSDGTRETQKLVVK